MAAWHADGRFASVIGRQVVGKAMAWRQADALQEAGVHHTYAMLLGGDRGQVITQIADLYIARRDVLICSGSKRGITVSAPTNDDLAEAGAAIWVKSTAGISRWATTAMS